MKSTIPVVLAFALGGASAHTEVPAPPLIEIIGVAANTSRSSGGHSALRIGEQVYQYQSVDDKMLFLQREPWSFFDHRYRKLDNRSLTLVRLDLAGKDIRLIHSRLNRLFMVQKKHLARWEALKTEQQWFDHLESGQPSVSIPIVGYFDPDSRNDPDASQLRISVENTLSPAFIDDELAKVTEMLSKNALQASRWAQDGIAIDSYPHTSEIAAERRLEQLGLREALIILKQGRTLSPNSLIAPDPQNLSVNDRMQLRQLAQGFAQSLPRLLASPRPDRGNALLLALARHCAIRQSLKQDRLLLLNVFPAEEDTTILLDPRETRRHRKLLDSLSDQSFAVWQEERRLFMDGEVPLDESGYQRMENAAARYIEPRNAIREGRALRTCASGFLRPARGGPTTPLIIESPPSETLIKSRQASDLSSTNFLAGLRRAYGYSLFHHNCVTELADAIQSAFSDEKTIRASLGAVIEPERGLNLIPAEFTRQVQRRWKTVSTEALPSHRQEQADLAARGAPGPWVKLRESNRWTSTVYPGSIHDDAFLFFSDGPVLWRPLQGSANLLHGLAHTGLGLASSPTESGRRRVKLGLSGMFYSLPEVFGISIRKGRYDVLPRDGVDTP